ncbi:hypothetical protein RRG08_017577 [Elysia crispata]|uniref:Uncharacterized protein n=1 Tax=Elysia crispata TaxID=231223 RepID=A0AAE1CX83_9GAST|nr:hypothetical protein RRG08_017577 [Elysia crispata]
MVRHFFVGANGCKPERILCLRLSAPSYKGGSNSLWDGEKDKKKIEELKRQLAEEKRASKEAVSKLHRELYRQRQTSPANSAALCTHTIYQAGCGPGVVRHGLGSSCRQAE